MRAESDCDPDCVIAASHKIHGAKEQHHFLVLSMCADGIFATNLTQDRDLIRTGPSLHAQIRAVPHDLPLVGKSIIIGRVARIPPACPALMVNSLPSLADNHAQSAGAAF